MTEITKERANQLYSMMRFLNSNGNHRVRVNDSLNRYAKRAIYQLLDLKGRTIAEINRSDDKYYYQEF